MPPERYRWSGAEEVSSSRVTDPDTRGVGPRDGVTVEGGYAKIRIRVTRNTQL